MRVTVEALRGFALCRGASVAALTELAASSSSATLAAGASVFVEGQKAYAVVLIRSGLLRVVRRDQTPTVTLGVFGPRDVMGLPAAMTAGPYPASAEVLSRGAHVIRLPALALKRVMDAEPAVLADVNAVLLEHTRILWAKIDVLTGRDVEQRLARLFMHLLDRFGDEREDGAVFLPIVLARRQLADLVGAREETVIRAMRRWTRSGLVASEEGGVRVPTLARLSAIASS